MQGPLICPCVFQSVSSTLQTVFPPFSAILGVGVHSAPGNLLLLLPSWADHSCPHILPTPPSPQLCPHLPRKHFFLYCGCHNHQEAVPSLQREVEESGPGGQEGGLTAIQGSSKLTGRWNSQFCKFLKSRGATLTGSQMEGQGVSSPSVFLSFFLSGNVEGWSLGHTQCCSGLLLTRLREHTWQG